MSIENKSQRTFKKVLLLGILGIFLLGMQSCAGEPESTEGTAMEVIPGTTFQHEGNLTFYYGDSLKTEIQIEIAETEGAITQGLMHRRSMDFDGGMLFIFSDNVIRSFWMKNTIIPLDIIYVSEDMKIVSIKDHTTPYSTDPVPSDGKIAKYVIEVNSGFAGKYGLKEGDMISFERL